MVYTDWAPEVLCTLIKVPGSADIAHTRPIGIVDILRNCFMGIQFKLIVTVWVNTGVLSQKQFGSLPNKGTEQARLVQVLALEFAWVM